MASLQRLAPRLLENVALEGRGGISVRRVLEMHEPSGDPAMRDACWRVLRASGTTAPFPVHFQASATNTTPLTDVPLVLADALAMDLWVVACEDLRWRALYVTNVKVADISATQMTLLETVGKARDRGVSMMDLTAAVVVAGTKKEADIRAVHHVLDGLLSQKLVVKKMLQTGGGTGRRKRFNVIVLARFAASFDHAAAFPGSILEEDLSWKHHTLTQMVAYMTAHELDQCVLTDAVREVASQKYKLEAFKNYIITEGQKQGATFPVEIFTAVVGTDTKRKLWCVKRRAMTAPLNPLAHLPRLAVEAGVLYQIHMLVQRSDGLTTPEIRNHLEIPGSKLTYRLMNVSTSAYPVRMTKVVVGRNSVFKIYPAAPESTPLKRKARDDDDELQVPENGKRRVHGHSLKKNSSRLESDLPVDDTTAVRSAHILARVAKERVVSLYSLRSSIIEMENFHMRDSNVQFIVGHRVDTRSIVRILRGLETAGELSQHQMRVPFKTTTVPGTRLVHCVAAKDATPAELREYVVKHTRDNRIQVLHNKAFANPAMAVTNGAVKPVDPSKITYQLKTKINEVHTVMLVRTKQARTLGMSYGMLYRCRLFHTLVYAYLQSSPPALAAVVEDTSLDADHVLFSLDHVLQSLKLRQYIRIFGIGQVLTPDEYAAVERSLAADVPLDALPAALRAKVTHRQNRRCARLLNTLKALRLLSAYRLRLEQLAQLLQADTAVDAGLDVAALVEHSVGDHATSSLLVWHRHVRIFLDAPDGSFADASVARVTTTRHRYSFGHDIPLQMALTSPAAVETYWEALQCVALESLSFSAGPGQIQLFPKPVRVRYVNLYVPISWTALTQSVRYDKRKERELAIPGSGRPTRTSRPRPEAAKDKRREAKGGRRRRAVDVEHVDFTPEEDRAMLAAYCAQLEANWRVPVPAEMQADGEEVAVRAPHVYRVNVSLVAVGRALGRPAPPTTGPVRRRIDELLDQVPTKHELKALHARLFGATPFAEEAAIQTAPRLAALLVRVLMIVLSPDNAYVQMAAEHLLVSWTRHEINTVWRYLWLRGWIVQASAAPQRALHRGYVASHKLRLLWRDGVSLPLALFEEAAEHSALLDAIEDDEDGVVVDVGAPVTHAAFVAGRCQFQLEYQSGDGDAPRKRKRLRASDRNKSEGIAGHLHKLQTCEDPWTVSTLFLPSPDDDDELPQAFSSVLPPPPAKKSRTTAPNILDPLRAAGADGCTGAELAASLDVPACAVPELVRQAGAAVLAVQGYDRPRFVLREHEDMWTVRAYSVATNGDAVFDTSEPGAVGHPWLKLNGSLNAPWWARIQRKVLHFVLGAPGATDASVWAHMDKLLPLQEVRVLLAELVREDVCYARIVANRPCDLFSDVAPVVGVPEAPLLDIDLDAWTVRYFAAPDCIEKLGMLLRDAQ
ncbi:hypothetical protein ACHHYP_02068 [Achlya hypogyna]|uniref:B-block binding subunit of TFIIIC domain-containing protein n=1 Tax=Achlya hypogyna TaxID=1202772 RepID=A0A1V9ZSD0_ACHHY|nr:hypothetical protein ACHHYP_02068 [Achlya hypogyna]